MANFSAVHAALSGVRLIRDRPGAIAIWVVFNVAFMVLLMAAMSMLMGEAMSEMMAIQELGEEADPQAAMGAAAKMMVGYAAIMPIYLIYSAIIVGAATRAVLRPENSGLGYLRLGGDEFRLLVVFIVLGVISFIAYLIGAIIAGIATAGAAMSGGGDTERAGLVMVAVLVPIMLLIGVFLLKFVLAPAETVATRSIRVFGSWKLTRPFGKVLVTYLLVVLQYVAVYAIVLALLAGLAVVLGQEASEAFSALMQPDITALASTFQPLMIGYMVLMGVATAIGSALFFSPGAEIYREIAHRDVDEAFS